jgi:hypothetical protein
MKFARGPPQLPSTPLLTDTTLPTLLKNLNRLGAQAAAQWHCMGQDSPKEEQQAREIFLLQLIHPEERKFALRISQPLICQFSMQKMKSLISPP